MSPVDVLLLTQARCDFCDRAKALLERLGSDFELRVSELDLRSPDGRRIAESHGILFAPGSCSTASWCRTDDLRSVGFARCYVSVSSSRIGYHDTL